MSDKPNLSPEAAELMGKMLIEICRNAGIIASSDDSKVVHAAAVFLVIDRKSGLIEETHVMTTTPQDTKAFLVKHAGIALVELLGNFAQGKAT